MPGFRPLLLATASLLLAGHLTATQLGPPPTPANVSDRLASADWRGIRAALEEGRHAFEPTTSGWQAHNSGQQWLVTFDRRGFIARPKSGAWEWGLELRSYGFDDALQQAVHGTPAVKAEGRHLSYQWNTTVQEWFNNDRHGLEHGFTIARRPEAAATGRGPGTQPLLILLSTRGPFQPVAAPDGQSVQFQNADGVTVVNYRDLKVTDADGRVLVSRFEASTGPTVRLLVEEREARYPLTIDPAAQQAYFKASNTTADDWFGQAVAISGDTVVIGAYREDSNTTGVNGSQSNDAAPESDAAYVFVRKGGVWTQEAYLKASNAGAYDNFGGAVAISGDTIVVGARWEGSSATGVNGNQNNNSSPYSGAAYVFIRHDGIWTQEAYLKASNAEANDTFGSAVAISEDTVIVGAPQEDSSAKGVDLDPSNNQAADSGAAYVFVRNAGVWTQQAYLKASNTGAQDAFGGAVGISGDTVIVGAVWEDSAATGVNRPQNNELSPDSGAAYIFVRNGGAWTQQAYLKSASTNRGMRDSFGYSVSVAGDLAVVGVPGDISNAQQVDGNHNDGAPYSGAAYVFVRRAGDWTQQAYLKASNSERYDNFGISVAISGEAVIVGAIGESSENLAPGSGAAYLFVPSAEVWSQQAYLKASNAGASDSFGGSVAISGDTVLIGAIGEDSRSVGVNGLQRDDHAQQSGAAYLFHWFTPDVIAPTIADLTATSATLGATLQADSSLSFSWRGVVYAVTATNANPLMQGPGVTEAIDLGTTPGTFTIPVSGLKADTGYSFRAYALRGPGVTYGDVATFTTKPLPANVTPSATRIGKSGGNLALTFSGAAGFTYRIQYATNLVGPLTWNDFSPAALHTLAADGSFTHLDVAPDDSARLYRAILVE